jgi:hypothetical protein
MVAGRNGRSLGAGGTYGHRLLWPGSWDEAAMTRLLWFGSIALTLLFSNTSSATPITLPRPCLASSLLSSEIGTTCFIGDKAFAFFGYNSGAGGGAVAPTADQITFMPDANVADNPGFILSSSAFTLTTTAVASFSGQLDFAVTIPNTNQLDSISLLFTGATATVVTNLYPTVDGLLAGCGSSVFAGVGAFISNPNPAGTGPCVAQTGTQGFQALFGVSATSSNGLPVSGSFDSVEFNFHQVPAAVSPTPEPSSVLLFSTGLLGIFGAARRKWRG